MATKKITLSDVMLTSTWSRTTIKRNTTAVGSATGGLTGGGYYSSATTPTLGTASQTVSFDLDAGSVITGAIIHAEWSNALTGFQTRQIQNKNAPQSGNTALTVSSNATSLTIPFAFRDNGYVIGAENQQVGGHQHSSVVTVSNIYVIVEYESSGATTVPTTPGSLTCLTPSASAAPNYTVDSDEVQLSWAGSTCPDPNPVRFYDV